MEGWWHKLKCSSALVTYQAQFSANSQTPTPHSSLGHSPACVVTNSVTKLFLSYSNIFLPICDFNVFSYLPHNNLVLFLDSCAALNPTLGAIFHFFTLLPNFFFVFICLPVYFIFFFSPEAKVIFFPAFVFSFMLSSSLSILSFLPIHFPIALLFAASGKWAVSLLYHYSLFLLVARETNRQCNRCQFCIQLPV